MVYPSPQPQAAAPVGPQPAPQYTASELAYEGDEIGFLEEERNDRFRVAIAFQAGVGSADARQVEAGVVRDSSDYTLHFSPGFMAMFSFLPFEHLSVGARVDYFALRGSDGIDLDCPAISLSIGGRLPIGDIVELFLEGVAGVVFTIQTDGEGLGEPEAWNTNWRALRVWSIWDAPWRGPRMVVSSEL